MNKVKTISVSVAFVLAMAGTTLTAYADEALVCPEGEHATSTLVSEAVPAVAEVSHVVHHEAVVDEEGTVITEAWDETVVDTPAVAEVPAVYNYSCEADEEEGTIEEEATTTPPVVSTSTEEVLFSTTAGGRLAPSHRSVGARNEVRLDVAEIWERLRAIDTVLFAILRALL